MRVKDYAPHIVAETSVDGRLEEWIRGNGFEIAGEPVWARYNPPFSLWFLRRNEILIPVATRPAP